VIAVGSIDRKAVVAIFAVAAATVLVGVAPARAAAGPVWSIVSVSQPTVFVPNSPRAEVDSVTVDATGGTFTLGFANNAARTSSLPYNASAAEVQAALNVNEVLFNAATATVTGGPGGPGGGSAYVITFGGSLAGESLVSHGLGKLVVDGGALTGGAHSATVSVLTKGEDTPQLVVTATNVGGSSTDGSPITISDVLPAGLTVSAIAGRDTYQVVNEGMFSRGGGVLTCESSPIPSCTTSDQVDPGDTLIITIRLAVGSVEEGSSLPNQATVFGGGAESATVGTPVAVGSVPAGFGIAPGSVISALSTTQAGAHPNFTTAFTLNTNGVFISPSNGVATGLPAGDPKDVRFDLPPGLVGNTVGMPRCTMAAVASIYNNPSNCPADTMVGMALVHSSATVFYTPVFNIAPAPGEPAAFAFDAYVITVRLDTSVLSDGSYGVRVTAPGITELSQPLSTWVTVWGIPADHNGPGPDKSDIGSFGSPNPGETRVPLLTNPQQCSTPLSTTMSTDPWVSPGAFQSVTVPSGMLTGCGLLTFVSSFSMLPDTLEAGEPAGYTLDLRVPQGNDPNAFAQPAVRRVVTALPMGTVISPSAAWGLKACSDEQFFGPVSQRGLQQPAVPGACPRESQVGTVTIRTPALELPLQGQVYLAGPSCAPCTPRDAQDGRMVRLFLQVVGEGESGIVVKLEGTAQVNQQTGQITATFDNNPQLPFSDLKLTLGGGSRATLANRGCVGLRARTWI
jgi:hypothetical protein